MTTPRLSASSIVLNETSWMIIGGNGGNLNTSEILSLDGNVEAGPEVPRKVFGGCFFKLNETTAFLFGGGIQRIYPTTTHFYSIPDRKWTPGPELGIGRLLPVCGVVQDTSGSGQQHVVISKGFVAGGGLPTTTEILTIGTSQWKSINVTGDFVGSLVAPSTIVDQDGLSLIVSGGYDQNYYQQKAIFKFQCHNGTSCSWTFVSESQFPRHGHVSIIRPQLNPKRLIMTGNYGPVAGLVEEINITEELLPGHCSTKRVPDFPYYPQEPNGQAAFLLNDEILITCGGADYNQQAISISCYGLTQFGWVLGPSMSFGRRMASAIALNETSWLVIGGNTLDSLRSTDIMSVNSNIYEAMDPDLFDSRPSDFPEPVPGPNIPRGFMAGCFVKINDTTALAFSGFNGYEYPTQSHYYSIPDKTWRDGPLINTGRILSACGLIQDLEDNEISYVVMAGGRVDGQDQAEYLSSVEILRLDQDAWIEVMDLPVPLAGASASTTLDGKSLVVNGGYSPQYGGRQKSMYRLHCISGYCMWQKTSSELAVQRYGHISMFVPDNNFPCFE